MKIVIIGAGTSAKSVANIILENKSHSILGFIGSSEESKKYKNKNIINDYKLIGDRQILKELKRYDIYGFVVAVGDVRLRESLYYEAINSNLIPISALSRYAIISQSAKISKGVIIKPGVIIGHNVCINENCKIDTGCIIEINSNIGSHCTIGAGVLINGETKIKKNVSVGSRAIVKSYINIGKNQIIKDNQIIENNLPDLQRLE